MYSKSEEPKNLKPHIDPDLDNKLQSSKEWHKLTELQKRICIAHWMDPKASKRSLAESVGCSIQTIYGFFGTPVYHKVAFEIDKLDFITIRALAKQALIERVNGITSIGMDPDVFTLGFARRAGGQASRSRDSWAADAASSSSTTGRSPSRSMKGRNFSERSRSLAR